MADEIRIGRISSVNISKGMARVTYPDRDDAVTADLPLLAHEYQMPKIGDIVLVLHMPGGHENGVIIGKIYAESQLPDKVGKDVYQKIFDSKSQIYTSAGSVTLEADKLAVKTAGGITISSSGGSLMLSDQSGSISLASIIGHIGG